jgi:hypothetical protein
MYHKRTFWVVAHRHFPLKELCPQKVSKSLASLRNTGLQNSIQLDMCHAQAYSFECASRTHYVLLSTLAMFILQPKVPFLIKEHKRNLSQ